MHDQLSTEWWYTISGKSDLGVFTAIFCKTQINFQNVATNGGIISQGLSSCVQLIPCYVNFLYVNVPIKKLSES